MSTTEFHEKNHVTIIAPVALSSQKRQKMKFRSTFTAFREAVTSFQGLKLFFFFVNFYKVK